MSQATTTTLHRQADAPVTQESIAARAQNILDAQLSSHSGTTRPAYAVAGTVWTDTDTGQQLYYDGTNDLPIGRWVAAAPALATSPGQPGDMFVDATYAYFCIAAATWVRVAVATW